MHDVTIRAARAEDAAVIADLNGQLGYPTSAAEMAERLATIGNDAVLVATQGEIVIAWIQVAITSSLESGAFAEIRGLIVDESHRSARIGAALVAAGEAWVRERGIARIRVRSNVIRERTHRFYERLGYVGKKSQRVFDKKV
ncbi:MAG TPA: GNAT family N-acetyltransferase [Thermoanaerobaculia bacterium]|nr:GNAT family N-acetyltransferase [Thermoanaerobaculia bacterium]